MHLQSQPKLNEKWLSIIFIAKLHLVYHPQYQLYSLQLLCVFVVNVLFFNAANYFLLPFSLEILCCRILFSFVVCYLLLVYANFTMAKNKECQNTTKIKDD